MGEESKIPPKPQKSMNNNNNHNHLIATESGDALRYDGEKKKPSPVQYFIIFSQDLKLYIYFYIPK